MSRAVRRSTLVLMTLLVVDAAPALAGQQNATALLAQAEAAFEEGNATVAEHAYDRVLELDAEHPRALFRLAQLRREDPLAAVTLLRRYVSVEPFDAWGHLALADAFARAGRADAAVEAYGRALSSEPGDADIQLGWPRLLMTLGRVDEAIAVFEGWLSSHAADADVWRELAAARQRTGRLRGAVDALERARDLLPGDGSLDTRIDTLRARTAASMQIGFVGVGETGASTTGTSVGMDFPSGDRTRVGVTYQRRRVAALAEVEQAHRFGITATTRPRSDLQLNMSGGVQWTMAPAPGTPARHPDMAFRLRRIGPAKGILFDVRAQQNPIDVTPELMRAPVTRTQLGTSIDVPVGGPLRLRAQGRAARLARGGEQNRRTGVGGGAALSLAPGVSATGQWQQTRHSNPLARGYFAPRIAEAADVGLEFERDYERVSIALDAGAGMQRFQRGTERSMSPWAPTLRVWGVVGWHVTTRQQFLVELESYDSVLGDAIVATDRWRYASVTASFRLALP